LAAAVHRRVQAEQLWAAKEPGRYLTNVISHVAHLLTVFIAASLIKMIERGRYDLQGHVLEGVLRNLIRF
jgi:hypothetical protein